MGTTAELRRQLGLTSATAVVVGEVIGVGIFLTPAGMARALGSPSLLLAMWLGMGVVTLAGAVCMAELAARLPAAGGLYVYLREAYGGRIAFLFGWMSLLVIDPGLTAVLATGFAEYLDYVVGLSSLGLRIAALSAILVLAVVNLVGVRMAAGLLRGLTVLKLGLLAFLACWGLAWGLGDWSHFVLFLERRSGTPPLMEALPGAMVMAFFSYAGWWDMSKLAGEVRDPGRTLPRALSLGVLVVTAAYVLVSAVFLYLVPMDQVTSNEAFVGQAGEVLFGRTGGSILAAIVCVAVAGSLTSFLLGAPRVYYAMALDGLFVPGVAALHPRFETPARAIAIQAVLASVLALTGGFNEILGYFFFGVVVFLMVTVAAVFVLRRRFGISDGYRLPGYPWTPWFFLVPCAVLLILLAMDNPVRASVGIAILLVGVPVYHLWVGKEKAA